MPARQDFMAARGRLVIVAVDSRQTLVLFFMDFIIGFSKVDGMNTIMVVVERFTKYVVFVATRQCIQPKWPLSYSTAT